MFTAWKPGLARPTPATKENAGMTLGDATPHPARILDYWLGGHDNLAPDREAARAMTDPARGGHRGLRQLAVENRQFLLRATSWLACNAGIRQFVDAGCGLPAAREIHDAARLVVPGAAVAYVDKDPVVVSHVRAALEGAGRGLAAVQADVQDRVAVLGDAGLLEVIDLTRPVAVIFGGTLSGMPADAARKVVGRYAEALAPGSAIVISCARFEDEELGRRIADVLSPDGAWRNHAVADVASFFAGLKLIRGEIGDVRRWPLLPLSAPRDAFMAGEAGLIP